LKRSNSNGYRTKKKSCLFILWRVILYIKERDTFTFICLGSIHRAQGLSKASLRPAFSVSLGTLRQGTGAEGGGNRQRNRQ